MQQFRTIHRVRIGVFASLVALLLIGSIACSRDTPEQALRLQVDALQTAIEARNAGDVRDLLAEEFIGNEGLDRRSAHQLAAATFLRHRDIAASIGPVSVDMRGETEAIARFSVLATGGSGGLLPDSGQVYHFETGWRVVDGEWKLLNARWTPNL